MVITHYNDPDGLSDCIASWLDQTVNPREIIVVDDGSLDADLDRTKNIALCGAMASAFRGGPKIALHPTTKNLGVPAAMNTGLREVTGSYVHFASCSDVPDRHFIETFLPHISPQQGEAGPLAVFGRARWVDDRTGVEWTSGPGDLVSHAAVFRVAGLKPFAQALRWHCDWWAMKQATKAPAFAHDVVKTIHLQRGQYSDVDRYGDENLDVLHELITQIEGSSDALRTKAADESWLSDFGLPAVIAAFYHPHGRVFLNATMIRRAAWRELEILGRRYLPAWAQRLAIRLFIT